MNTLFSTLFLFSFIASTVFAQNFTINTPTNLVQCQPVQLTWVGGTPPYFLSVLPQGQPNANALVSFAALNDTSLTWRVNITAGVGVFFNLRENSGVLAQSAPVTILTSSDSSCINASAVVPFTAITTSGAATSTSVSGSNSASAASTTGTSKGASSKVASSTGTGASASPSNAAAASHYAPFGTLAMTGAALAFALVL